jgi:hypothetical protein
MSKRKQQIHYYGEAPDFLKMLSGGRIQQSGSTSEDRQEQQKQSPIDDDPQVVVLHQGDLTQVQVEQLKDKGFSFEQEPPHKSTSQLEKEIKAKKALEDYEREIGKHLFRKTASTKQTDSITSSKHSNFRNASLSSGKPKEGEIQVKKSKLSKLSFEEEEE